MAHGRHLKTDISLFIAFLLFATTALAHGNLKFVNGKWLDGGRFVEKTVYSVEGVLRDRFDGEVRQTIDLGGRFVIPPLADDHNHVLGDNGNVDEQIRQYLRAGVFYVKNPNSTLKLSTAAKAKMNTPETPDVLYANGGLTASGGHPMQIYDALAAHVGWTPKQMENEAYVIIDNTADLAQKWPRILAGKPGVIKTYLDHSEEFAKRKDDPKYYGQRGLDPQVLRAIVVRAHRDGLPVATHVTTSADFHNALAAGVDEIAHLPLEPIAADDAARAARQHVTVVTTLLSHRPTPEGIIPIHQANLALLKRAGVNVVLGTDNGEKTVVDEALALAHFGVYTNAEILAMWTTATPRAIFPKRKIGQLADGYEASFLALDANPLDDLAAVRKIGVRVKHGHVVEIAPEKPGVADLLIPIAQKEGAAGALAEYRRLQKEAAEKYDFREPQLNRVGYALMKDHLAEAVAIFKANTELFPQSANVWDSLAEAQLNSGDREAAIANYRKSLALNPHNANAAEMLKKLGTQ
jgi:imidazolonepropionase-like amidohydrolase